MSVESVRRASRDEVQGKTTGRGAEMGYRGDHKVRGRGLNLGWKAKRGGGAARAELREEALRVPSLLLLVGIWS
jgi:hypothetical protein